MKVDESEKSTSFGTAGRSKLTMSDLVAGDDVKCVVQSAVLRIARTGEEVMRIVRIMAFLHSAKDLPSVLRLYGVESSGSVQA